MTEHVHTIVVGAGVVGLAVARRLAADCGEVLILERADAIGTGISSRNSEVIHAGMYYATGTLKARACVAGRRMLYDYCRDTGVGHKRVGKLIVATDENQLAQLRTIEERSRINGLTTPDDALQWLEPSQVRQLEPELDCVAALWSPATGIIDTHALMLSFLGDAERSGGMLSPLTSFVSAQRTADGWLVQTRGVEGEFEISCTHLVNCGGLQAQRVAAGIAGLDDKFIPPALWLKGNYFSVAGRKPPFTHLIYPVPSGGGLGVHLTLDMGGQARFGPDTEAVDASAIEADAPDYVVDPRRANLFYAAIRTYWPGLPDGALQAAYSGIRPKLARGGPGLDANDFEVSGPAQHGLPGLVQLFGIESPGITASMALADAVAAAFDMPA